MGTMYSVCMCVCVRALTCDLIRACCGTANPCLPPCPSLDRSCWSASRKMRRGGAAHSSSLQQGHKQTTQSRCCCKALTTGGEAMAVAGMCVNRCRAVHPASAD